LITYRNG